MIQKKPSTEDLLKLLQEAEALKDTLDKEAQSHDLLSGIVTEVSVGVTALMINKMSLLLLGTTILSNPMLLAIFVTSGLCGAYYPKMKAFLQRHSLYRKYGVVSDHIDYVAGIVKEFNESNK